MRQLPGPRSVIPFEATAGVTRRLAELALGLAWAVLLLISLFPPSGDRDLTWFVAPICALFSVHFSRRAFDSRPRLLVDETGVTDRTSVFGGELHIPWEALRRVSTSRLNGVVELEVLDLKAVQARAGFRRRLQILMRRMIGKKTIEVRPTLLGIDGLTLARLLEEELEGFERAQLGLGRRAPSLSDPTGPEAEGESG